MFYHLGTNAMASKPLGDWAEKEHASASSVSSHRFSLQAQPYTTRTRAESLESEWRMAFSHAIKLLSFSSQIFFLSYTISRSFSNRRACLRSSLRKVHNPTESLAAPHILHTHFPGETFPFLTHLFFLELLLLFRQR